MTDDRPVTVPVSAASSEQRTREIEERANAATPGPWLFSGRDIAWETAVQAVRLTVSEADAEFITAAREDIPYLLALLRAREQETAEARDEALWYGRWEKEARLHTGTKQLKDAAVRDVDKLREALIGLQFVTGCWCTLDGDHDYGCEAARAALGADR